MKNLLTTLVLSILFFSCQTTKDEFSIKGTIDHIKTGKVYLQKIVDGRPQSIDTADVVNGEFTFKGKMETPDIRVLRLDEQDYIALNETPMA